MRYIAYINNIFSTAPAENKYSTVAIKKIMILPTYK